MNEKRAAQHPSALVLKRAERGDEVDALALIDALWWRVRNQKREIARLHESRTALLRLQTSSEPARPPKLPGLVFDEVSDVPAAMWDEPLLKRCADWFAAYMHDRENYDEATQLLAALRDKGPWAK